jgi:DNA-directed RNA polymerase alpha subunit
MAGVDNPMKVKDLFLSARVHEILRKKKIKTVGALVFTDLGSIKGLGPKALDEIAKEVRRFGVKHINRGKK